MTELFSWFENSVTVTQLFQYHLTLNCHQLYNIALKTDRIRTLSVCVCVCVCVCKSSSSHEVIWGNGSRAPLILNHGTRWSWVVSFMPWLPHPKGSTACYPLSTRLSWRHSQFGCSEKSYLAVSGSKVFLVHYKMQTSLCIFMDTEDLKILLKL